METPQALLYHFYPDRITDEFYLTFSLTLDNLKESKIGLLTMN